MSGWTEKLCFVLMPFREELKAVYTDAIQPACERAGFKAVRADELVGPYNIHRDIIEYIFRSDVIITDLTGWNPNVFYEMGVAHAIDNKTIMIIQKGQDVPFDIHNYRCISYHLNETGLRELTQHLI
ncbi:MAG: nucleoside 2-deoxyribosyltransferase, partial [candidate division KSB1 bacterium]|nr:nucleoside 2-deoxyribosyltransferase [candidate division KSB1 bacterium]